MPSEAASPTSDEKVAVRTHQRSFGNGRLRAALVLSDVVSVSIGWAIAASVGLNFNGSPMQIGGFGLLLVGFTVGWFVTSRLYLTRVCSVRALETAAIFRACVLGGVCAWMVAGRLNITSVRVRAVVVSQLLAVVFVFLGRSIYRAALRRHRSIGRHARPVVLIGGGEEVFELHQLLSQQPELGYEVIGSIGNAGEMTAWARGLRYLGPLSTATTTMRLAGAKGAIVAGSGLSLRDMNRVVRDVSDAGFHVQLFGGLLGIDPKRLQMNPIGGQAAFYLEQVELSGLQARVKRFADLVFGAVGLVAAAPVIGLFALLARLDGGSAFFRQVRVGRDGRPFTLFKIRTMVMNAEELKPALQATNERKGPLFKMDNDPRFTRLGRFMDATSINELPQLWNVVRGEMSLVGPRPALASEAVTFNERLLMRNRVRPGITGLWQVSGRDAASFATYERCDVFYVENWSMRLDIMILVQTVIHIAARSLYWRRKGSVARHPSHSAIDQMATTLGSSIETADARNMARAQ